MSASLQIWDALIRPAAPVRALHDAMWNAVLISRRAGLQPATMRSTTNAARAIFRPRLNQRHGEHSFPAPVGAIRIGARPPLRMSAQTFNAGVLIRAQLQHQNSPQRPPVLCSGNLRFQFGDGLCWPLIWRTCSAFVVRRSRTSQIAHLRVAGSSLSRLPYRWILIASSVCTWSASSFCRQQQIVVTPFRSSCFACRSPAWIPVLRRRLMRALGHLLYRLIQSFFAARDPAAFSGSTL